MTFLLIMILASSLIYLPKNNIIDVILLLVIDTPIIIGAFVTTKFGTNKLIVKEIKKEYYDVDFDVNIEELKKELENYEVLSKIPKDIEKQQEEHLNKFDHNFKKMSPEEKINLLEKEKNFGNK